MYLHKKSQDYLGGKKDIKEKYSLRYVKMYRKIMIIVIKRELCWNKDK